MKLIIVGCGRIGSELAQNISKGGHQVTVIDRSNEAFTRLGTDFHGRTVCGEVLDQNVLLRAGIEEADGLAAVTSDDATNFVVGRAAKEFFHVENIVVRAYDPRRRAAFEALGIRSIASSSWGAQRLSQLLTHPGKSSIMSLGHGEVTLVEIKIGPKYAGRSISALEAHGYPVAIIRNGDAMLPDPNIFLEADDLAIFSTATAAISDKEA